MAENQIADALGLPQLNQVSARPPKKVHEYQRTINLENERRPIKLEVDGGQEMIERIRDMNDVPRIR